MKKAIIVLLAAVALVGCQQKQESTQAPVVTPDRKEMGQKLMLKSIQDLEKKDLKGAISSLEEAIKVNPTEPEAYLLMSQILLKVGEYGHAADFLEQTVKNFPDNGTAFYMMSIANRMVGKKLPAVLAARRSAEIFQAANDKENFTKSAVLLQELIDTKDDQFAADVKQAAAQTTSAKE